MTLYAYVKDNTIVRVGVLPQFWVDETGVEHIWGQKPYRTNPEDCGWFEVDQTLPPEGDKFHYLSEIQLLNGRPHMVWVEKPVSEKEARLRIRRKAFEALEDSILENESSLEDLITVLEPLLADEMVAGSIKELRANLPPTYNRQAMRVLVDLILLQAKQTRALARQTLRLSRLLAKADLRPRQ